MMSIVLGDEGRLIGSWTTPWTEPTPDQTKMIAMVRGLNDLRRQYPGHLFDGRMIAPFAVVSSESASDGDASSPRQYPSVLSSFWENAKGERIGFLTNWRDCPVKATLTYADGRHEERRLTAHETQVLVSGRGLLWSDWRGSDPRPQH